MLDRSMKIKSHHSINSLLQARIPDMCVFILNNHNHAHLKADGSMIQQSPKSKATRFIYKMMQ